MKRLSGVLLTGVVVAIAVGVAAYKYWDYVTNPWTRNGQVRAQIVQITPRVSAPIVNLPIADNQFVKSGDLLFEMDARTFKAARDKAAAELDKTRSDIVALQKQVEAEEATVKQYASLVKQAKIETRRYQADLKDAKATFERMSQAVKSGAVSQVQFDKTEAAYEVAQANYDEALANVIEVDAQRLQSEAALEKARADLGAPGDDNARLRGAKAALETAELNLEFTKVTAPVDGFVTNLNLRIGDQAVTNQPALALIDVESFWVHGFFKETLIEDVRKGDHAVVTLMSYPDQPLEGRVDSIGWGIAQDDGSTGVDLLPNVSPTFEWIRLAQRVPVRVHLLNVPDDVELRVGTTASVLVMTGTAGTSSDASVLAVPRALQ